MKSPDALLSRLAARGVILPHDPASVFVAQDVDPERFHAGATIHPFCRVEGGASAMGPGAVLGGEGPATLKNSQLGAGASLAAGFADRCTLLDGASAGSGFHGRPGTLLEEGAGVAHCVGLKQTILFPFVEFGSLVNFCDAVVTGGTGPKDHTEVGSSYVHFNFTPHGDKATASLVGDVPHGALLRSPRIFLGGQGGLTGPRRIAFGAVVPAGTVLRDDVTAEDTLVRPSPPHSGDRKWDPAQFGRADARVDACLDYVGNILALRAWYELARAPLMLRTPWGAACHAGSLARIDTILAERVKRLRELLGKMEKAGAAVPRDATARLAKAEATLAAHAEPPRAGSAAAAALDALRAAPEGTAWPRAVQALPQEGADALSEWLSGIAKI